MKWATAVSVRRTTSSNSTWIIIADANALADELGFDGWVQMFNARMSPYNFTWNLGSETDPYSPTLNTFVFTSEDSFGNKHYERNPYFFKVDVEGNQLPYTDSIAPDPGRGSASPGLEGHRR